MSQSTNIAGNLYDKFNSRNPIAKRLMSGYLQEFERMLQPISPVRMLEVGCGEGHILERLNRLFPSARAGGLDVSLDVLRLAKPRVGASALTAASANALPFPDGNFDLVVCVEVLEHLPDPGKAISELVRVSSQHLLISVPNEPIWRILNVLRGAYVGRLGNTPGHIQHWRPTEFVNFVADYCRIRDVARPLPWIMVGGTVAS